MKKLFLTVALILLALGTYLSLWPVPIKAVTWSAAAAPGYVGVHAANNKLAGLKMISLGQEEGPEHIVLAKDGKLSTAIRLTKSCGFSSGNSSSSMSGE